MSLKGGKGRRRIAVEAEDQHGFTLSVGRGHMDRAAQVERSDCT